MSQSFDILRRLQEYEILPPPEVADCVFTSLNKTRNSNNETIWNGCLDRLGQLELQPPPALRSSIENVILNAPLTVVYPENRKSIPVPAKKGTAKKIFLTYAYRSVAACVLFAIAVWAIYRSNLPHKSMRLAASQKTATLPVSRQNAAITQNGDTVTEKAVATNPSAPLDSSAGSGSRMVRIRQNPSFSVEGHSLPVNDNDLLITLTSYKYDEIPGFINRKEDDEVKIHVDAYSNVYVSGSMLRMIKEMYDVRSSGKPTRKARKAKAKLGQWKKKDETRFDEAAGNNPLDPIDLARFIFK